MSRLIVVLPAYNEEDCLPPLLRKFRKLFRYYAAKSAGFDPLVIVVDDGSKDRTAAVALEAAKKMPVRLVQHPQNKGLGEAIKTGLRAAMEESTSDADVFVLMDADDTHPPHYVIPMLKRIDAGADMVIASRYRPGSKQVGIPLNRWFMSQVARWLFVLFLGLPGVRDYTCGFRAYRSGLIRRSLEHYGDEIITRNGFACTDQLLVNIACLGNIRIREIPFILRYDRKVGPSKLNLGVTVLETFKLLWHANRKLYHARRGGQVV